MRKRIVNINGNCHFQRIVYIDNNNNLKNVENGIACKYSMYVPTREYQKYHKVSATQLRAWADAGKIDSIRTPGGSRLYRFPVATESETVEQKDIIYCRVSSHKQRADLQRQKDYMVALFPEYKIVEDVGSGINWKRPGLLSILDDAIRGRVRTVAVANRDRLCRFAFELLQHLFEELGVRLVVVDGAESEERELADDLLSIVQVFCCRRNGRRKYKHPEGPQAADQSDNVAETSPRAIQEHEEGGVE